MAHCAPSSSHDEARYPIYIMHIHLQPYIARISDPILPISPTPYSPYLRPRTPHISDRALTTFPSPPLPHQASVGVHLVRSLQEARAVYDGLSRCAVSSDESEVGARCLVMEALEGREWVVDTVSRDGQHKACPTLPHPTLPHPTPPYPTLPHPTPARACKRACKRACSVPVSVQACL